MSTDSRPREVSGDQTDERQAPALLIYDVAKRRFGESGTGSDPSIREGTARGMPAHK
jgi:hypothetical protein